jgi:hypothetical protein
MLIRVSLGEEALYELQQLAQGIAGKGMKLLADGLLIIVNKGKSFRFFAPGRGALKQRLRYTTQAEVAFDRFLLAYLRCLQAHGLFAKLMKDLDRPAIAPHPNYPPSFPVQGIGE